MHSPQGSLRRERGRDEGGREGREINIQSFVQLTRASVKEYEEEVDIRMVFSLNQVSQYCCKATCTIDYNYIFACTHATSFI